HAACAALSNGTREDDGCSAGIANIVRRAPGTAATIASRKSGVKWKARQRSPVACSWPHSKQLPSSPSSTAPGASTAEPRVERYWNVPSVTAAMHAAWCRSSNGRSCGPAVHATSLTLQPGPDANRREVNAMPQTSNFSQAAEGESGLGMTTLTYERVGT